MKVKWYYGRHDNHSGPVTSTELKNLAIDGKLVPTDLVWKEGLSEWVTASSIKGLFSNAEKSNFIFSPNQCVGDDVVQCPGCQTPYHVDLAKYTNQKVKCPSCKNIFRLRVKKGVPGFSLFSLCDRSAGTFKLDDQQVASIREFLSIQAEQIPHHGIDDFGNAIEILSAVCIPIHRVKLSTLAETRKVSEKEKPYTGHHIPPLATTMANVDEWSYTFDKMTEFEEHQEEHILDDSQSVHGCQTCNEKGNVTCPDCHGNRRVQCPDCEGAGIVACPRCNGSTQIKRTRYRKAQKSCPGCAGTGDPSRGVNPLAAIGGVIDRKRGMSTPGICSHCHGKGWIWGNEAETYYERCASCNQGRVRCGTCDGDGEVTCERCQGNGIVTCQICEGHTKLVAYLALIRTHRPAFDNLVLPCLPIPDFVSAKIDFDWDFDHIETIADDKLDVEVTMKVSSLEKGIKEVVSKSNIVNSKDTRICWQEAVIDQSPLCHVRYKLADKEFKVWLAGRGMTLLAEQSPFVDRIQEKLETSLQDWEAGNKSSSVKLLQQGKQMAKKDYACKAVLESYANRIPTSLSAAASASDFAENTKAWFVKWFAWLKKLFAPKKVDKNVEVNLEV